MWQWALAIFCIAGREKNLQRVSMAVHEAVGMAVPPSRKSQHTMIDLGHWKVPRAKYRWSLLFLFAYRWTRSWAALRRPGSQLTPRNDWAIFALFPHIISQGLREFKCDLLGSDESLSLRYLSNELLYTSHLTALILNLEREILSLPGNPDFEKEGAASTLKLAS